MSGMKDGIVKRGGSWSYVVRVDGRPKWVGGFPTAKAAKDARDDARVAARRGTWVDRDAVTVSEYLTTWLDGLSATVKPTTARQYRDKLTSYVIPRLGSLRVQAVRPSQVAKLSADLLAAGGKDGRALSPRSVALTLAILSRAFRHAVEVDRLVESNPVTKVPKPRVERPDRRSVLSPEQIAALLSAADGTTWQAFLRLAAYTGARRGEVLGLRWADVDLDAATVTYRTNAVSVGGQRVEQSPKGGRARTVQIDAGTVTALRAHRSAQRSRRLSARTWTDHGLVTANPDGSPPRPDSATYAFARLATKAGIAGFHLHDLRHAHATHLLRAGVPVHVVAQRLGHKDAVVTMTVYAHVLDEQAVGAADAFAAAMGE